jgi:hypothetical protein
MDANQIDDDPNGNYADVAPGETNTDYLDVVDKSEEDMYDEENF